MNMKYNEISKWKLLMLRRKSTYSLIVEGKKIVFNISIKKFPRTFFYDKRYEDPFQIKCMDRHKT